MKKIRDYLGSKLIILGALIASDEYVALFIQKTKENT